MIQQLFKKLEKEKLMLSSVESLTGGLFAASITSVPGASSIFSGGTVTYSLEAKRKFGVEAKTLEEFGAISKETAVEMAKNCLRNFSSQVAISFTGNAGPSSSEGKAVGLVFITIIIKTNTIEKTYNYRLNLDGDRAMIREQCVNFGIKTIMEKLNLLFPEEEK
ncbi:MAG TPA: CinA family protein [Firmicutes bacterium]|nr:CinA family protein [Bacillota bacterium]